MTEGMPTLAEQLERDTEEMRGVVQARLRAIDQRLEEINAERTELQSSKRRYDSFLRNLDGTGIYASKNSRPKTRSRMDFGFSEERVQAVVEWLQEHREELNANGGFSVPGLLRQPERLEGLPMAKAQSQLAKMFRVLRDREVITLSRQGRGGSPRGEKFYKVI